MRHTPISPLNFKLFKTLLAVGASSLAMFFVISLPIIYSLNFLVVILIGMAVYFILFGIFYWLFNKNIYKRIKDIFIS
jgi:exosortase/archaeosortase